MLVPLLFAAVVGYVLGALPFGYLVARAHGVDIFTVGSKTPGATNVRRVLGAKAGNLVFALDALKGATATALPLLLDRAGLLARLPGWSEPVRWLPLAVAGLVGALIGHSFSCFTRFRGGKGVATASGGFIVLMPVATLIATVVWIVTFYAFRYVSLASILAAVTLPFAAWGAHRPPLVIGLAALVAVFVLLRHRANIGRLLNGTEARFQRKKSSSGS